MDEEDKIMEVVVEDKQLSLAIGKKGQNVRRQPLVGWRIDIKSEEKRGRWPAWSAWSKSCGARRCRRKVVQSPIDAGIQGLPHLLEMSDEDLLSLEGIGPKTVEKLRSAASAAQDEWTRRDAEETARLEAEQAAADAAHAAAEAEAAAAEVEAAAAEAARVEAEAAVAVGVAEGQPEGGTGEGGEPDGER